MKTLWCYCSCWYHVVFERRHVFVTLLCCWHQIHSHSHSHSLPTFNGAHLPYWVAVYLWYLCSPLSSLTSSNTGNLFIHLCDTFLNPLHFVLLLIQEYYHNLLSSRGCTGISVKQDGNFGKGFFFFFFFL